MKIKSIAPKAPRNQIILKGSTVPPPTFKNGSRSSALTYSQLALDAAVAADLSELRVEALQPHELEEAVAGLGDPTDSLALVAAEYQV